jgi:hypothetical protein
LNWRKIFSTDETDANLSRIVSLNSKKQREEFKVVGI